jgi:pyruvate, orthophosphate dikinase
LTRSSSKYGAALDTDVPAEGLVELCQAYEDVYQQHTGQPFPQDPLTQLELSIEAVFRSWMAPRAIRYREVENIRGLLGTAVNVQSMVYGNMGLDSGTGVAFTRNPSTGENKFYGEFLVNAQGEDVVSGIRTPQPVSQMPDWKTPELPTLGKDVYKQLLEIKKILEDHYREMQDIEFTIERGTLFMLQTRTGKRTGAAAVKIACDLVKEKLIDEKTALLRIPANGLTQLLLPSFSPEAKKKAEVLATGLPASPGAAVGQAGVYGRGSRPADRRRRDGVAGPQRDQPRGHRRHAQRRRDLDQHRRHDQPRGGGRPRLGPLLRGRGRRDPDRREGPQDQGRRQDVHPQGHVSIDGSTGEVMAGAVATEEPKLSGDFAKVMKWADQYRTLKIRTNADTPGDAQRARDFGAEGIGLCRTEHMFFEGDRIKAMREMILAETEEARRAALAKLLPYQREDFIGIFTAMKNLPVTIRLLDPPLHEFLPHDAKAQQEMAATLGVKAGGGQGASTSCTKPTRCSDTAAAG